MDWDTETNLVSDVRLKRYIRDYLKNVQGKELFVTDEALDAKNRVFQIINREPTKDKPIKEDELKTIINKLIDIKYFGAVFGTSGGNDHITGPIQFNWGYSLNKVELQESKTITSSFSSGEGVGKDYRVNYSFIAFSGSINGLIAEQTMLKDEDINLFDKAMIESIPLNKTRSKEGQTPRLYLRVELKDNKSFLKDLREYIFLPVDIKNNRKLREIKDIQLDINQLIDYLIKNDSKILKVHYWKDDNLFLIKDDSELNKLKNKINKL